MPTNPEGWQKRQAAIELLARAPIGSQTELLKKLASRGFHATQSSVSRDLREMHVAKADGRYVLSEALAAGAAPAGAPVTTLGLIKAIKPAGPNLLVIQTPAGSASAVSLAIDALQWPDVVGTVAGDDTLLVATANRGDQARVASRLAGIVQEKSGMPELKRKRSRSS